MSAGILSAFLFCLLTLSSACYVQNCPRGGKRSLPDAEIRQCRHCGPENTQKCVCCPESSVCLDGPEARESCRSKKSLKFSCQVS